MSTTLSAIVRTAVTRGSRALSGLFSAYCDEIATRFVRRTAIACLRELDDRALRDVSLARSHIEAAVCGFVTPSGQTGDVMESAAVPVHARTGDRRSNRGGDPWNRRLPPS